MVVVMVDRAATVAVVVAMVAVMVDRAATVAAVVAMVAVMIVRAATVIAGAAMVAVMANGVVVPEGYVATVVKHHRRRVHGVGEDWLEGAQRV